MKIALGSDHHGIEAAGKLLAHLKAEGHEPFVLGECTGDACDYPDSAFLVGRAVADGEAEFGILVCGSGIGMSMAANKVPGVRAGLAHDAHAAEMTRRHNNANVLCLSGSNPSLDVLAITDAFLAAPFDGGRHERRVSKLATIERGENPVEGKVQAC